MHRSMTLYRPLPRAGLLSFNEYRETEILNRQYTVARDGTLLEYETLELRVHPPNVDIDNTTYTDKTVITVDSANRPGTLVEVVQCLTELGLSVRLARISSDGGWFIDEFHVTECDNTRVLNEKKLAAIRKVLNVHFQGATACDGIPANHLFRTVFELVGHDRPGVLADAVQLLTQNYLEVESVAVWTYGTRCAFVICALDAEPLTKESTKLKRLCERLMLVMDPNGTGIVKADTQTKGAVHYERRLHQLMLAESETAYVEDHAKSVDKDHCTDAHLISPKYSKPEVDVSWDSQRGYWLVDVKCKDRNKLVFDTICTLADLAFDIWHGTVDTELDQATQTYHATQTYYVRPRCGFTSWDPEKAAKLKFLLEASIQRRFPKGVKVHIKAKDNGCLPMVTQAWKSSGLLITRAKVRTYSDSTDHTFYLMDGSGGPPDETKVQEACQQSGGCALTTKDEAKVASFGDGAQFFFSLLHRAWDGSPNSCVSSFN